MHLAEGTLPLVQAAGWTAVAAPTLVWSLRSEKNASNDDESSSVLMAGVTSLLFAVTLLPLPVPVVGATSHICITPVLALLVGVRRIVWPTFFVLLLQALFFAHGGLTTLGANTFTLGVLGPLTTLTLWTVLRKCGVTSTVSLAVACGLGGLSVYVADALILAAALSNIADPMTTFTGVLLGFAPVQVPLAILEAAISVGLIRTLNTRRPQLVPDSLRVNPKPHTAIANAAVVMTTIGLAGCNYEGIDGSVFGATAESAGQPPTASLIDLSQGEVGLATSIIVLFGLGFIAGRSWERLMRGGNDALPR